MIRWARYAMTGYEVSTKGDKRFSALVARMPDTRTIETHYQCDIKGYPRWRDGKGKPPKSDISVAELRQKYLHLWQIWAAANPDLIEELDRTLDDDAILTDMFVGRSTVVSQAWALAHILNHRRGSL